MIISQSMIAAEGYYIPQVDITVYSIEELAYICMYKGYALDSLRPLLHEAGIRHALVNLGNSSILALGNHPSGEGWKLGHDLVLSDQCLTTSGNEHEGHTHIINPQTGQPVTGKRQIRVITPQGVWGEVCSTALFACPDEHRPALIEALRPELISCHQDTIG